MIKTDTGKIYVRPEIEAMTIAQKRQRLQAITSEIEDIDSVPDYQLPEAMQRSQELLNEIEEINYSLGVERGI